MANVSSSLVQLWEALREAGIRPSDLEIVTKDRNAFYALQSVIESEIRLIPRTDRGSILHPPMMVVMTDLKIKSAQ